MTSDILKIELLTELGYGSQQETLLDRLAAAGLTNPRKERIHRSKAGLVEAALREDFVRLCGREECRAWLRESGDPRSPVQATEAEKCDVCGGSDNRREVDRMVPACERAGWVRLCVVGGSPSTRRQLEELVGGRLALRLIDGTAGRTRQRANDDLRWADHVVVWGSTELNHSVSGLYTGSVKTTTIAKRGIAELAKHVATSAQRAFLGDFR